MKALYLADGPWSHKALIDLVNNNIEVVKVITRYDTQDQILIKLANDFNIPVTKFKNVNDEQVLNELQSLNCQLAISMSFNQIFRKNFIDTFPLGVINCHAGKLPFYRGRNILNWALINDEKEIGVTCHYVDESIDTGDIIIQRTFEVTDNDTYATVLEKAIDLCPKVLVESTLQIKNETVTRTEQPKEGSYCRQRKVGDEIIDWNWNTRQIFNFVRAITKPGPGAQTKLINNNNIIFIWKSNATSSKVTTDVPNGSVIEFNEDGNPIVKTKDGALEICEYNVVDGESLKVGDKLV